MKTCFLFPWVTLCAAGTILAQAEGLDPAVQAKLDGMAKEIQSWAADPVLVQAVQAHNANPPADHVGVTQDRWKALTVLDPFVRSFSQNDAGQNLKRRKTEVVTEAFLSDAEGRKVAFLTKPSNWCHQGKPKHDVPMTGKVWQGAVEVDESTGLQQVQVAVPVLADGKPIGSLVVGLSLAKLGK